MSRIWGKWLLYNAGVAIQRKSPSESKVEVSSTVEHVPILQLDNSTLECITQSSAPQTSLMVRTLEWWLSTDSWSTPDPLSQNRQGEGLGIQMFHQDHGANLLSDTFLSSYSRLSREVKCSKSKMSSLTAEPWRNEAIFFWVIFIRTV